MESWPTKKWGIGEKRLRTPGLDFYNICTVTIIVFAKQYKNDNSVFHRSFEVSGSLALL